MKVLFPCFYPMWSFHFASDLNLIEEQLERGHQVTVLQCHAALRACEPNRDHLHAHCARCIGIRQEGFGLLSRAISTQDLIPPDVRLPALPRNFGSVQELKAFSYAGFAAGIATYSSLVDATRNAAPDLRKERRLVRRLLEDTVLNLESARRRLGSGKFELLVLFNGRYAATRPWLHVASELGIPFLVHERSFDPERTFLYENHIPHDPMPYAARIQRFWEDAGSGAEVRREAEDFFEERPQGQMKGWTSFTGAQNGDQLPTGWDNTRRNFVIFATTEREFLAIREATPPGLFRTQSEAFAEVVRQAGQLEGVDIYIRLHPNSVGERCRWWERPVFAEAPNVRIVPAESTVSSYQLLFQCEKAITFRSSMGVEATYWGKPSIALVYPFYGGLDAVYYPRTLEELSGLLAQRLKPKPKECALKFAAFMRRGGWKLPYSRAENYYTLDFKNKPLESSPKVLRWLADCEKRAPVTGIRRFLREWRDGAHFRKLWRQTGGDFSASGEVLVRNGNRPDST